MFKVGDKVVCVNSKFLEHLKTQIYTVKKLRGENFIYVTDLKGHDIQGSYFNWRFITLAESRKNKIKKINKI